MKVRDLILILETFPEEMTVYLVDEDSRPKLHHIEMVEKSTFDLSVNGSVYGSTEVVTIN